MRSELEHGHRVRKRQFVDASLQSQLLIGLVGLEFIMLVAAVGYLYYAFDAHIEASLFTIHRSAQGSLLAKFLSEMGWVVVVMGGINTLALYVAHCLWLRHIRAVVGAFRKQLERIAQLDLTAAGETRRVRHEVLSLLDSWRQQEVARSARVDELLEQLSCQPLDKARLHPLLRELDRCLQSVR